ncbi:MAG: putative Ig domain-containing protein [Bacteroidota bacterium]
MNKRYYHWIKLQRRYRATQQRWAENQERHLKVKLDRIGRRLHRLNRSWRLGVSTAALTAWLMATPGASANAQVFGTSIELSDLDGTNGFHFFGEEGGELSPSFVGPAGDLNGDGIDDIVIGTQYSNYNGTAGAAFVVFGKEGASAFEANMKFSELDGTNGFRFVGENAYDNLGVSVSTAGDVNNDGIDDLIIGANFASPDSRSLAGETYVVFGKAATEEFEEEIVPADLNGTNGFRIQGANNSDQSGRSVSGAGDINGDGIDDLIIGAIVANKAHIVFGGDTFAPSLDLADLDGTDGFTILSGGNLFPQLGGAVSTAGDVNGDGIDDFIMGARLADQNAGNAGASCVVFGKTEAFENELDIDDLDGTDGFILTGENAGDNSGSAVSKAGDVNNDGIDDLLIGAMNSDPNGNASGTTYIVFGKPEDEAFEDEVVLADLNGSDGFKVLGEDPGDRSGHSVSRAGDVNNDGIDDFIIGAYHADTNGTNAGTTYVLFGKAETDTFEEDINLTELASTDGFKLFGEQDSDRSGQSVSGAGDVNGDGIDDFIVGANFFDANTNTTGGIYVVFGRREPMAPVIGTSLPDNLSALEGEAFSYQIPDGTFSDPNPSDSFTFSANLADGSALPAWLTLDAATGTFSGTPTGADADVLTIRVTATDKDGLTESDEFVLTVNDIPMLAAIEDQVVNTDQTVTFTSTADNQIGTLSFSLDETSTGKGMTIDETSGTFSWTPTANDTGAHEVTVSVSDGEASDEETFIITVRIPLGISLPDHDVLIFPNPTHGVLKVEGLTGIFRAIVYSLSGKQVLVQQEVTNGHLDIGHLEAGSYLVTFGKNGKTLLQTRIVKIN